MLKRCMAWCQFSDQLLHFSGSSAACHALSTLVCLQAVLHLLFLHWSLYTAYFGVAQAGSPTVMASGSKVAHLGQIVSYIAMPIHSLCIFWTKKWRVHWPHANVACGQWVVCGPGYGGHTCTAKATCMVHRKAGESAKVVYMVIIAIAICQWSLHACMTPHAGWVHGSPASAI